MEWNATPLMGAMIFLAWVSFAIWLGVKVEEKTYSLGLSLLATVGAFVPPWAVAMGFEQ